MSDTDKTEEDKEIELAAKIIVSMNKNLKIDHYKNIDGINYNFVSNSELFSIVKETTKSQKEKIEELESIIENSDSFAKKMFLSSSKNHELSSEISTKMIDSLKTELSEKNKQIESMRCCGNCGHLQSINRGDMDCDIYDTCSTHVKGAAGSHWKPRS